MTFVILFMWISLVVTYGSGGVQKGSYLLGITLPTRFRGEPQVTEVLQDYQKAVRGINLLALVCGLLLLFLSDYLSFQFPCLLLWFFAMIQLYQDNVEKYARRLYQVKRQNGWLAENSHVVRIDTALARVGEKGAVSFLWYLPAWVLGGIGVLPWLGPEKSKAFLAAGILCLSVQFLLAVCALAIRKSKPRVYCSDTLANQKLSNVIKREWSRCMLVHSYGVAAFILFLRWRAGQDLSEVFLDGMDLTVSQLFSLLLILGVGCLGTIFSLWRVHKRIEAVREQIDQSLEAKGAEIYGDEDEYWLYGGGTGGGKIPSPGLTEKRIGIGLTFSSSLEGGIAERVVYGLLAVFCLGFFLFFLPFDFADIRMDIQEGTCSIQAASFSCHFALEDVEEIVWVDERPRMSKIGGLDSNRFYLGSFRVKDYGKCKVYLSLEHSAAIRVTTKEETIWFNDDSLEGTREFYEKLLLSY